VRALLDLMREARPPKSADGFAMLLEQASKRLTILDPKVGEEELIQAVAAALAKLRIP
jgi:hypothetical protein